MGKESIGVWLFAGVIGLTGLGASGYLGDPNELLEPFKSFSSSTQTPENTSSASLKSDRSAAPEVENSTNVAENSATKSEVEAAKKNEEVSSPADEPQDAKSKIDTGTSAEVAAASEPVAPVPENIVPTFDILRVEPNGDMVIAGVAADNADVEIVAGSKTLAVTKSNNRGEFVAIIDEPLKQGDYEIVLRATQDDGTVATSLETAIVSIPEKGSNDVLALVEAPGAPSRLITKSETEKPLQVVEAPKQTEPEPEINNEVAKSTQTVKTAEPEETAKAAVAPNQEAQPQQKAGELVRIEAVEIDGEKVFVAGATDAGARIRVYANEIVLGEDLANDEGRFLVEANRNLPVGDYVIRADRLSKNGIDVVSRAAVPFARSEGSKLAAVAVPQAPKLPLTPPVANQSGESSDDKNNVKSALENIPDGNTNNDAPSDLRTQTEQTPQAAKQSDVADVTNAQDGSTGAQNTVSEIEQGVIEQATTAASDGITPTGNVNEQLKPVDSSVIIRRGDTLWQISRRVYGRGIKYTTIYQANEDQIKNPHKIWPGQVFALPGKAEDPETVAN